MVMPFQGFVARGHSSLTTETPAASQPSVTPHSEQVRAILQNIAAQAQLLEQGEPESREALLTQALALVGALNSPNESIYSYLLAEASHPQVTKYALVFIVLT